MDIDEIEIEERDDAIPPEDFALIWQLACARMVASGDGFDASIRFAVSRWWGLRLADEVTYGTVVAGEEGRGRVVRLWHDGKTWRTTSSDT